jgi:hypothetical protein
VVNDEPERLAEKQDVASAVVLSLGKSCNRLPSEGERRLGQVERV